MFAHKMVSVLRGDRNTDMKLQAVMLDKGEEGTIEIITSTADCIENSEKFDFGDLHLEPDPQRPESFILPLLTHDEKSAWAEGLIPLPAEKCWYEFLIGGQRSALLAFEGNNNDLYVARFDWRPGNTFMFDGVWLNLNREENKHSEYLASKLYIGSTSFAEYAEEKNLRELYTANGPLAVYLTLMINSKTTETEKITPPAKLNKARIKAKKQPLPIHRIVRIIPKEYLRARLAESGRTRLSPRLHWRRSHIRTLHRGEPNERKIIIPRFLVSRASEAEVTHEYRVG
jgi:hypothetical protein